MLADAAAGAGVGHDAHAHALDLNGTRDWTALSAHGADLSPLCETIKGLDLRDEPRSGWRRSRARRRRLAQAEQIATCELGGHGVPIKLLTSLCWSSCAEGAWHWVQL